MEEAVGTTAVLVTCVATAGAPWPRMPRPPIKPGAGAEVLMAALVTVNVPVVGSPETARSHAASSFASYRFAAIAAEGQLAGGMVNASIEGYLAFQFFQPGGVSSYSVFVFLCVRFGGRCWG